MGGGAATLDLTNYNGVMAGGVSGLSVISGDHQNSELYNRITLPEGAAGSMPPNDPLSPEEINLIAEWINEGASNLSSENYTLPQNIILNQNYPNPFNPQIKIPFSLTRGQNVKISIIDLNGKIINVLSNQYFDPGNHFVTFSNQKIPSGVYFININHKNGSKTQKITYLK